MKKSSFFIGMAAAALLAACSTVTAPQDAALFDHFTYVGQDNFYAEHPLTADDEVYNPMLPGWYSDPSICSNGEGDYFMVTSTFVYYPGVPVFHSRDLVNWEQIGHVLTTPGQTARFTGQQVSGGIYAPDIKYNPANKTYYMITTNIATGNFFVKTQDPWGEWSEPIALTQVSGIDPSFFFDDDGKAYIENNDDAPDYKPEYDGHRTIRIHEFDVASDMVIGTERILIDRGSRPEENPRWIEGPHIYKINGMYYLMAAEGGTGPNEKHSEVIFRSDNPLGGFVPWSGNPILAQFDLAPDRKDPVTCTGHADMVQDPSGAWWAVFLGCRPINGDYENLGRETFMLPVEWTEDGFPVILPQGKAVPMTVRHPGVPRGEKMLSGNFSVTDEFDSSALDMTWLTLRGPATELYSLSEFPGFLKLSCADALLSQRGVPAAVLRRLQHHAFEASTRMYFCPEAGRQAGMTLFKDERHYLWFYVGAQDGKPFIALQNIGAGASGSEPVFTGKFKFIDLKIVSDGQKFAFWYALDGKSWTLFQETPARPLSTTAAGGFTGTTVGLYAGRL